ncbi:MAG: YceI family protein [Xanthomonadales bacterium]|nr:YceI family protein [Xanthomonadales bacterium]
MRMLALVLAITVALPAAAADYRVGAGSTLGFLADFQGEKFSGQFKTFEATIRYDPADLASSKFDVEVDLASVVTGDSDRDDALPGADFFDVARTPKARYTTTGFRKDGDKVIADGTLTLKGKSKPVSLAVRFHSGSDATFLDVTTTLKRLDFDVGAGEYADTSTIGNEVAVNGHLVLVAK